MAAKNKKIGGFSFLARQSKKKEKWLRQNKIQDCSISQLLDRIRPDIQGTRRNRTNKSEVYKRASEILSKCNISGSYCGLSAAYFGEIYQTLSPNVQGLFVNCEYKKSLANQLKDYTSILSWLYNTEFKLFEGNIFDCLNKTKNKFSIVDLDLMTCMATPLFSARQKLEPILESIENSTTQKFMLLLWSTYGMKALTEERYDTEVRDTLLKMIRMKHKILEHKNFKYCDNHIPIKVELLALSKRQQRRKKNDKETNTSTKSISHTQSTPSPT